MTKEDTIERKLKGAMALGINKYSVEDLCQIIKQHYLGELDKDVPFLHHRGCECNKCWAAAAKNDTLADVRKVIGGD